MPAAIRGIPPKYDPIEHLPAPLKGLVRAVFPANDLHIPGGPLVAGTRPALIPYLREIGAKQLRQLRTHGLVVPGAERPKILGEILGLKPVSPLPVPEPFMKALEHTQKRYPRIFGHTVIEATPVKRQAETYGAQISSPGSKFSRIQLNPTMEDPLGSANTVGHEFLHAADAIADPQFTNKYDFFQSLPGGYDTNSMEQRARLMGDIMEEEMRTGLRPLRKR